MAFYLRISPIGDLVDMGTVNGRRNVVFNVRAMKLDSTTFEEELVKILQGAGLGTPGVNLFASGAAEIPPLSPSTPGPYIVVASTGGIAPSWTHDGGASYHRPSAQISVHATTYSSARAAAKTAYGALAAVNNQTVTP